MCWEARRKEFEYVDQKKVWGIASREKARANGWVTIGTRWVDISKGDDVSVSHRSRLVGKEFANKRVDGLFAGTPPLEALRFLVHEAATVDDSGSGGVGSQEERVIMSNNVARAFFDAKATRKICVELPEECAESLGGRNVALLNRSLYSTRDAAMNLQEEVAKEMHRWWLSRGQYNPCLYSHAERKVRAFLHGETLRAWATERRYGGSERRWKRGSRSKQASLGQGSEKYKKPGF